MTDVIIRGGLVVDGTGAPGRVADVAVDAGRITAVTAPGTADDGVGTTVVDATGLVVAPGFVDIHTHYDAQLSWDPTASPSTFHGVTTVIGGNCGFTLAPAGPEHAEYLMKLMARVEGMPLAALEAGLSWDWKDFGDWLGRLDGGIAVNAGFLAGHSAIRRVVMGDAAHDTATPEQVDAMARLLDDALAAGALGFSSSQAQTHNDGAGDPVPSRAATRDEMIALAAATGRRPGTTLECILAGTISGFTDDEVDLMASMSLAANRPLNWNVLGVSALNPDGWKHQLRASTVAAERGAHVLALTMPHLMAIRLTFLTGFVLDALPGWAEVIALPVPERISALRDPEVRRRLDEGAHSEGAGMLRNLASWGRLTFAETFAPENASVEGRTVAEVAAARGVPEFDALVDVVCADELRTGLRPPVMGDTDADWAERATVWRDDRTIVGASDAGAHLDMMCGAIYSTSLLGNGVRDRGLLTVEEAVHQLTQRPAALYGLRGRGVLAPGAAADIVVFDLDRVGPGPERTRDDLPGGARRLYAEAHGVEHVLVNGVEVARRGEATGATPGTLLRSGRDTDSVTVPGAK